MTNVDERIDQVLNGLSAPEVPARLEQRVMARVTQRSADAKELSASRSLAWQGWLSRLAPYAIGAAIAGVLCAGYIGLMAHHTPGATDQAQTHTNVFTPKSPMPQPSGTDVRGHVTRGAVTQSPSIVAAQPISTDDPDAIALAETMAPSHPAPPMPATPQELVAMRSGRSGHTVEMAELHTSNEPGFRTEHERTAIRQYILGLLDPLVTSQNLTSSPPPAEDSPSPTADTTSTN